MNLDVRWRVDLDRELNELLSSLDESVQQRGRDLGAVDPSHREDALNLAHYVALRRHDVRSLQKRLAERGLSSLGRCEPHVWATLRAVITAIGITPEPAGQGAPGFAAGVKALDANTDALLGPRPGGRVPRIMVTLPSEAAADPGLVADMARRGMDLARINGAHDSTDEWEAMARHVKAAETELGRRIPVCFDLPGPKVRTGPIRPGPPIVRLRPERDARGVAISPARFVLAPVPLSGPADFVPLSGGEMPRCGPGDEISLHDTRGSRRRLRVRAAGPDGLEVEVWDTTYLQSGMALTFADRTVTIGELAPVEQYHVLRPGDTLQVTTDVQPAPAWKPGMPGQATIGCTLPEAVGAVRPGHRVILDDGRLSGVVESTERQGARETWEFTVRITSARPGGSRLRSDRGINLPDTHLPVPMLAEADFDVLRTASSYGDLVGLSFVRHERDVDAVMGCLHQLAAQHLGLILKIETVPAFQRLPEILLRCMRWRRIGVMIARGDLAIEASYERLAEVQEEILWLAEAAHLPVIWATEVLDRMARSGRPTRAEITDAAMAQRAECVMLNKGPYIGDAISALDDILKRMAGHQRKKMALLRPLTSWAASD